MNVGFSIESFFSQHFKPIGILTSKVSIENSAYIVMKISCDDFLCLCCFEDSLFFFDFQQIGYNCLCVSEDLTYLVSTELLGFVDPYLVWEVFSHYFFR